MRFASLGSGSRGNATLVEAEDTRILVDCGFPLRELEQRLAQLGLTAGCLDAVLVTHEHSDHIKGVGALARARGVPVWMTAGTHSQQRCGRLPTLHLFNAHDPGFRVGSLEVQPFPVPHDAREPSQFLFRAQGVCFGMLTDTGSITSHIRALLQGCDALLLECNHDPDMLASGPYPPRLQARVGGSLGHLSNGQAAGLLGQMDLGRLRHLLAGHLSEKNNTRALVRQALLDACPRLEPRLSLASQHEVSGWFEI